MGIARRYGKSEADCQEIFQESFIKIFDNLHKWDSVKGEFKGWLYRVAVNEGLQYLRREKRFDTDDLDYVVEKYSDSPTDGDIQYEEALEMVNQLPTKQKIVFNLYVVEGYSHKEIGEQLNINEASSRSQLTRARESLKQIHLTHFAKF